MPRRHTDSHLDRLRHVDATVVGRDPHRRTVVRNLVVVGVVAGLAFVFLRAQLTPARDLVGRLSTVDQRLAVVGVLVSTIAVVNRGLTSRAAHAAVGLDVGVGEMTRTSAVAFAAQKIVRSAGAVGLAVFVRHGRRRDRSPGAVATVCVLTALGAFIGLGVVLATTICVLASTGRLTGWWLAAAAGFVVWSSFVVGTGAALVRGRAAAARTWTLVQRTRRAFGRLASDVPDPPMPTAVFDALDRSRRQRGALVGLVGHCVLGKCLGAVMLAVALAASGIGVEPTEVLVVYATALAASMLSILPGGIGTVEGSTMALLVAGGAPPATALLAIGLFRVFDLWLPLLIGAALARGDRQHPAEVAAGRTTTEPASELSGASDVPFAPCDPAVQPALVAVAA